MGILDWFKNRTSRYDHPAAEDESMRSALKKAVGLVNPRLSLLEQLDTALLPAIARSDRFIRNVLAELPPPVMLSAAEWVGSPLVKSLFASADKLNAVVAQSINVRTFLDKYPKAEGAFCVLGAAYRLESIAGLSLEYAARGSEAQTTLVFFDYGIRICGETLDEVKLLLGTQIFEYLIAQVLEDIAGERCERQELKDNKGVIQARLRLLRQQGPGLGSVLSDAPAKVQEISRLEQELVENERMLEEIGSERQVLQAELDSLVSVLGAPEKFVAIRPRSFFVDPMNIIGQPEGVGKYEKIELAEAVLTGSPAISRVFTLGYIARADMSAPNMNLSQAEKYL